LPSHQHRGARLLALPLALTLLGAACGGGTGENADPDVAGGGSGGDGAGSGTVDVSGSSTVEPISSAVAQLFEEANPDAVVNVDGPGTGDGFQLFCDGETDISDASRPISPEEIATCEENGVEFVELKIAFDGIAVLTNPANDTIACLNFADQYALVGPESQGFETWAAAQPLAGELGSNTELPELPLQITAPGAESGTYDSYVEIVLEDLAEEREQEAEPRPDYSSQGDDSAIIQATEANEGAFGWVGFAFADRAGEGVKILEIDGGDGCVAPSAETIADGSYPVSRPLFIYVSAEAAESNPTVAAYVDFYLGEGIDQVGEVGYVALPEDLLAETASAWEERRTGAKEA
jgi:phosphate transport system substrate-binding protein